MLHRRRRQPVSRGPARPGSYVASSGAKIASRISTAATISPAIASPIAPELQPEPVPSPPSRLPPRRRGIRQQPIARQRHDLVPLIPAMVGHGRAARQPLGLWMKYGQLFFDYVDEGAAQSAKTIAEILFPLLRPNSVLDVGCGRGGWLRAWKAAGAPRDLWHRRQLRRSDQAGGRARRVPTRRSRPPVRPRPQLRLRPSLEVGEHLPPPPLPASSRVSPATATSCCSPPPSPAKAARSTSTNGPSNSGARSSPSMATAPTTSCAPPSKAARKSSPGTASTRSSTPTAAGEARLPPEILATAVPETARVRNFTTPEWRVRRALVRYLPVRDRRPACRDQRQASPDAAPNGTALSSLAREAPSRRLARTRPGSVPEHRRALLQRAGSLAQHGPTIGRTARAPRPARPSQPGQAPSISSTTVRATRPGR